MYGTGILFEEPNPTGRVKMESHPAWVKRLRMASKWTRSGQQTYMEQERRFNHRRDTLLPAKTERQGLRFHWEPPTRPNWALQATVLATNETPPPKHTRGGECTARGKQPRKGKAPQTAQRWAKGKDPNSAREQERGVEKQQGLCVTLYDDDVYCI